jgi:hypothetical protein
MEGCLPAINDGRDELNRPPSVEREQIDLEFIPNKRAAAYVGHFVQIMSRPFDLLSGHRDQRR